MSVRVVRVRETELTCTESDRYRAESNRRGCQAELCREWGTTSRLVTSGTIAHSLTGSIQTVPGLSGLLYDGEYMLASDSTERH